MEEDIYSIKIEITLKPIYVLFTMLLPNGLCGTEYYGYPAKTAYISYKTMSNNDDIASLLTPLAKSEDFRNAFSQNLRDRESACFKQSTDISEFESIVIELERVK